MNRRLISNCFALLCIGTVALPCAAQSAPIPWQTERFDYTANAAPLADALSALASQTHVQIDVAPDVMGSVTGRFDLAPQAFLSAMASTYGVSWYYDGMVLHVAPQADRRTLAMRLNYASADALLAQLSSTGASDPRFAPQVDEATRTIVVSGPPAYVARIEATARALERTARERVRTAVRVVTLQSARAGDRHETIGGVPSVMPGVATRLRERFTQNRQKPFADGIVPLEFEAPLPIVEADIDRNTILIRDRPERLDGDAEMARAYDTKPPLVRIVGYVADVDPDALAALPLQWRAVDGSAPDVYAVPGTPPAARYAYSDDDGAALAAQLKEFVTEGRARMELQRDVLTADGTAVELDARAAKLVAAADDGVGGAGSDASLLDVPGGMTLDVTPAVEGAMDLPHVVLTTRFALAGGPPATVRVDVPSQRAVLIAAAPAGGVAPWIEGSDGGDQASSGRVPPRTRVVLLVPYAKGE
ncbi:secretin N-terminal domain-containing protein [Trinickia acidisoli]|uniref:secretin N-terminal domain-containing protein n=1 Tax=Trinickia acidisoli TaxID=2767482 RepID=UPI001A8E3AA5|nr:secretin N-terminal domain-containing protein [Trinickia acidisoli]